MKYKTIRAITSPAIRVLWPTKFFGTENIVLDTNVIYLCNHYSAMDSNPMVAKIFKNDFNVVIKEEAFKNKLSSCVLNKIGGIAIKRGDADTEAVKKILKVLKSQRPLLLFPEGTRNEDVKELLPFKDGAAFFALKTHSIIIPMLYYRKTKLFRKNYCLIGKPMDLSEFYTQKANVVKEQVTEMLYGKMSEMRVQLDEIVEKYRGNIKKYNAINKTELCAK